MKPNETLFDRFLIESAFVDENLDRAAQEIAVAAGPNYTAKWRYRNGYKVVLTPLSGGEPTVIPLKMTGHPSKKTWIAFDVSALPTAEMLALKAKYNTEPFQDNTDRKPTLELEFASIARAYEGEDEDEQ